MQHDILRIAMTLPQAENIALAGGGAMLAHGFIDRVTHDLDLFTPEAAAVAPLAEACRKPRIEVADGTVDVVLPSYFAKRRWCVRAEECAVTDLSTLLPVPRHSKRPPGSDAVFAMAVALPYFFTTAPISAPNLLIQFRQPQRVPALTWVAALAPNVDLPFSRRQSRSAAGAWLNGLLVRAVDPAEAVRILVAAGVEPTDQHN